MLYFDNNATTAPDPAVVDAMLPWLREHYGNPSSAHSLGTAAAEGLERARRQVAGLLGTRHARGVVFTSGATESLNTAIHSAARAAGPERRRVLGSPAEHSASLRAGEALGADRFEREELPLDRDGRIDLDHWIERIGPDCALVTAIWANNETGALLPREHIERVGAACRAQGVPFLLDAVQAAGKVALEIDALPVDLVALSAHKFHGPKGIGALWVRPELELAPLVRGGPQEHERRGGTQNVPGAVGMGVAAELAERHRADGTTLARVARLRDRLEAALVEGAGATVNGPRDEGSAPAAEARVANTTNLEFPELSGDALLMLLDAEGLAVSTGSACDSQHTAPSHVLLAMGRTPAEASSSLRFSLSRATTADEVEAAIAITLRSAETLRLLGAAAGPVGS